MLNNQPQSKVYKNCQSCYMPLKSDENRGKEADLTTPSLRYCKYCYDKGVFLQPDITAKEMQKFCEDLLVRDQKMPRFVAKLMVMGIPKLERWK